MPLEFAREVQWALKAKLFPPEPTDLALNDQPALNVSLEDALMEQVVSPGNLRRAWRQVKGNRRVPGPDGMKTSELEVWASENWAMVRQQLLEGTYRPQPVRRLTDLNRYVRGWIVYFGLARQFEEIADLDGWVRRRIRMCYWKQWRHPRTKVTNLVALGVSLDMAIKHAISRKKYRRMSRTPALRIAMSNKWLEQQGLLSLKQLWYESAYLRGTA